MTGKLITKKNTPMRTYNISLPCFSGFYGYEEYIYDYPCDIDYLESEYSDLHNEIKSNGLLDELNDLCIDNIDYQETCKKIAKGIVDRVYNDLLTCEDYVSSIDFLTLKSPRYYNYSTDEIIAEVKLSDEQFEELENTCFVTYENEFKRYLKDNYTSCSGYISFVPSDFEEFKNYKNKEEDIYLTLLLEFLISTQRDSLISPYDIDNINEYIVYKTNNDIVDFANQLVK